MEWVVIGIFKSVYVSFGGWARSWPPIYLEVNR